jgi:hypothetical protein
MINSFKLEASMSAYLIFLVLQISRRYARAIQEITFCQEDSIKPTIMREAEELER